MKKLILILLVTVLISCSAHVESKQEQEIQITSVDYSDSIISTEYDALLDETTIIYGKDESDAVIVIKQGYHVE